MSSAQHTERSTSDVPSEPTPAAAPTPGAAAAPTGAEAEMADETVDDEAQAAASQAGLESQGDYAGEMDGSRAAGGAA